MKIQLAVGGLANAKNLLNQFGYEHSGPGNGRRLISQNRIWHSGHTNVYILFIRE